MYGNNTPTRKILELLWLIRGRAIWDCSKQFPCGTFTEADVLKYLLREMMSCGYLRFTNEGADGQGRKVWCIGTRDRATGFPHAHNGVGSHPTRPSLFARSRHGEPGHPETNAVIELASINHYRQSRRFCVLVEQLSLLSKFREHGTGSVCLHQPRFSSQ